MKTIWMTVIMAIGLLVLTPARGEAVETKAVLKTYSDIAHAGYSDSLTTTKTLKAAIEKLLAKPTKEALAAARTA